MGKLLSRITRIADGAAEENRTNGETLRTNGEMLRANGEMLRANGEMPRAVVNQPTPPNPRPRIKKKIVRALYDYKPRQPEDLGFRCGDRIEVLNITENSDDADWWVARHVTTGEEGYIPTNYVVIDDNTPQSQEWWFTIDRREADKLLLLPGNPRGTFLVRESTDKRSFALSVRDYDAVLKEPTTRHYRIHIKSVIGTVYISKKKCFRDIIELVHFYKHNTGGLCSQLIKVCPKLPEPIPFKDLEVKRSDIVTVRRLGAGQFGEVYAGKWNKIVDVAVKTLKSNAMSSREFLQEAKIMHKLRHPKLVLLMGVCTKGEPMYIITELMVNGSLLDYLRRDHRTTLAIVEIIDIAAQIADGMAYLECQHYTHRDLRAANILVGEHNVVKVADFGLARFTTDDDVYTAGQDAKFPVKWTAPEAALHKKFSIKSDVWSFGICLYEIFTSGRVPYPGFDNSTALMEVERGYRMKCPNGCPSTVYDMMLKCWDKEPKSRPTFSYLYAFYDDFLSESSSQYDEQTL